MCVDAGKSGCLQMVSLVTRRLLAEKERFDEDYDKNMDGGAGQRGDKALACARQPVSIRLETVRFLFFNFFFIGTLFLRKLYSGIHFDA